jgi:competence protein ComEC
MQLLFVDVGQGACQLLLLGNREAIVIDSGSQPSVVLRTLRLFQIETLPLVIFSHSHADHTHAAARPTPSGFVGILEDYAEAIGEIALVVDSDLRTSAYGRFIVDKLKKGVWPKEKVRPIALTTDPLTLWRTADGATELSVLSPLGGQTLVALADDNPNASSMIVNLRHQGKNIVLSADSEVDQWRDLIRTRDGRKVECKIITIPHHGGGFGGEDADIEWLFKDAVSAEIAVVSVATVNRYSHPRPSVIRSAASAGCHVVCTQITPQCCENLEPLRPGVIGEIRHPCASKSKVDISLRRRSRNVACAGTISVLLDERGVTVERLSQHRDKVSELAARGGRPLCRP